MSAPRACLELSHAGVASGPSSPTCLSTQVERGAADVQRRGACRQAHSLFGERRWNESADSGLDNSKLVKTRWSTI